MNVAAIIFVIGGHCLRGDKVNAKGKFSRLLVWDGKQTDKLAIRASIRYNKKALSAIASLPG